MMNNAAATTSSFFQQFRIVSGFINVLQSLFRRREIQVEEADPEAPAVVGKEDDPETAAVGKEDDPEARPPESAEETNRAVRNSISKKALSILLIFPTSFFTFTLPGLFALLQIKWQLLQLGSPSPKLHNWYIVCVTSLITEFVASIAQWIISSAGP